ncbi:Epidermal Growth Factor Receptor Substrate 15-Like 1 [Manis pentadactyla]|nr:Epidermal Growth Factor Receptor Substrate 15-Like 1 [Manis pentadactyla]
MADCRQTAKTKPDNKRLTMTCFIRKLRKELFKKIKSRSDRSPPSSGSDHLEEKPRRNATVGSDGFQGVTPHSTPGEKYKLRTHLPCHLQSGFLSKKRFNKDQN